MSRKLTVLFRRDPARDRRENKIDYEGYEVLWPDGQPLGVGFDAFCKHGQRLFSLGRHMAGRRERFMDVLCFPLGGRDDDLTRLPGARVRRFYVERRGRQGRIPLMDGTPAAIVFDLQRDEPRVLQWVGLPGLHDGERQRFDLAAQPAELPPWPDGSLHLLTHDATLTPDAAF